MKPVEVVIPPQTPEGVWCFNGSMLVRHSDGHFSNYLESDTEQLEVVFRERIGTDGNIYACRMKPYTWEVSDIRPLFSTPQRIHEDPRIWLYRGQPHLSFTHDHKTLVFSRYIPESNLIPDWFVLPIGGNGSSPMPQKNWGFFQHDNNLGIVYCPGSHFTLIELKMEGNALGLAGVSNEPWTSEEFRGGSPPVFWNGLYYIFVHKMGNYNIWAIAFGKDEDGKWRVKSYTPERLNTEKGYEEEIHFVSGALFDKQRKQWILTGGIRDHHIAIWTLSHEDLLRKMVSV
jgi:hypothetical protein